jgi:hypothetical protein
LTSLDIDAILMTVDTQERTMSEIQLVHFAFGSEPSVHSRTLGQPKPRARATGRTNLIARGRLPIRLRLAGAARPVATTGACACPA